MQVKEVHPGPKNLDSSSTETEDEDDVDEEERMRLKLAKDIARRQSAPAQFFEKHKFGGLKFKGARARSPPPPQSLSSPDEEEEEEGENNVTNNNFRKKFRKEFAAGNSGMLLEELKLFWSIL